MTEVHTGSWNNIIVCTRPKSWARVLGPASEKKVLDFQYIYYYMGIHWNCFVGPNILYEGNSRISETSNVRKHEVGGETIQTCRNDYARGDRTI